jgi:hypothetical protein
VQVGEAVHGNGPELEVQVVVWPVQVTDAGQVVTVMIFVLVMVELLYRVVEDSMVDVSGGDVSGGDVSGGDVSGGAVVVLVSVVIVMLSVGYEEGEDESGGGVGQAGSATVIQEVPRQLFVHGLVQANSV